MTVSGALADASGVVASTFLNDEAVIEEAPKWADLDDTFDNEKVEIEEVFDQLVARQVEEHGDDLSEPCDEARELLDLWTMDLKEDSLPMWRAAVARRQPGVHAVEDKKWNDAELSGEGGHEWTALLDSTVHATYGRQYSDKKKQRQKGTPDDQWNGVAGTWRQLIEGSAGEESLFSAGRRDTTGFSRHQTHADKEGGSCVFGNCLGKHTNAAVDSCCAIGLDHDTGHVTCVEAKRHVADAGIAAFMYTTHSHLKTESEFKRDAVVKHAKCSGDPTLDDVKSYAVEIKRLASHVIESLSIVDTYRTGDGMQILVSHAPIDKFRVIIPFAEGDVKITEMGNTDSEAHALYERKVYGVADMLGIPTDAATTNVARLFYLPRHPAGAEHGITIHQAPPISFWDIPEAETGKANTGSRSERKFKRRPDVVTEDGTDVSALYDRYAKRWMLADICETAGLETSAHASNGGGKFHVRCPFADGHTNSGDDGSTFAMNAEDSQTEFAIVDCRHGSCQSANNNEKRHTVDYLGAWIDSGELDPELLQDPAFMLPLPDGETGKKFMQPTPDEDGEPDPDDAAASLDKKSKDEDVRDVARKLSKNCEDSGYRGRLAGAINTRVSQSKTDVNRLVREGWKKGRKSKRAKNNRPSVTLGDHRAACDAVRKIMTDQSDQPKLFHNTGRMVSIEEDENSNLRFAEVTLGVYKARIEDRIDLWREDEKGELKNVEATSGVVNRTYNGPLTDFPPIQRIVSAPVCGADGALVREPGYHASGVYYQPKPGVTIPEVSEKPTADEVRASVKKLSIPFREFPLDGMTPGEFDAALERGGDVPSFCHLLSYGLTPICRDIIHGPTPNHLARKMKPRTGATTILMHMGYIATLDYVVPMALPESKAEVVKTFVSMLEDGAPYGLLDNLSSAGEIESDEASSVITAYPYYKARRLNHNTMIKAPVKITWGSTGNKTSLSTQLAERTLLIQLDPKMEHPQDREFNLNLDEHVPANAGEYLHCLLTLYQNWKANGCPKWKGKPLGGFKSHAEVIGGILEAAGIHGFMQNRDKLKTIAKTEEPTSALLDAAIAARHEVPDEKDGVLFRAWGTQPPPQRVKNDDGDFVRFEYANYHVVSFRDLLNKYEIPLKNMGWVKTDMEGTIFYPDKAKQSVSQMVAGLTDDVREWDASKTEIAAQQGRYQVQKVRDDQYGALYELRLLE